MEQSYNLGVADKHIHPGNFQINHIRLYPHNVDFMEAEKEAEGFSSSSEPTKEQSSKYADIIGAVSSFSFAEGIYQSTILGEMIIIDATNMIENYRIQSGEKVEISITQKLEEKEKTIEVELYVSEILGIQKPNLGSQSYKLALSTKEHFLNNLKKVNEPFEGEPTELVKSIAKVHLGSECKSEGKGGGIIKGIYPKLRPFDAISFILRNSNDTQTPLFFFQGLKDGYQIKSYKSILDKLNSEEGVYSEYNNIPLRLPKSMEDSNYYEEHRKKIQNFVGITYSNKLGLAKKGAYKSRMQIVDLDNKKMTERDFTYNDKDLTLNKNLTISDVETSGINNFGDDEYKNSRNYFVSLNEFSKHLPENLLKTVSVSENLSDMKSQITLFGDPDLVPGCIINLKMFKDQPEDTLTKDKNPDNALLGGNYLVTGITHSFGADGYLMLVDIARDSSQLDFNEKVQL